jgi:hypothetical protein
MPTTEQTPPTPSAGVIAEPAESSAILFGRRRLTNAWHPQTQWVGLLLSPPLSEEEDLETATEQVLDHDEVSLEDVSLASGQVVINVTDEQADRLMELHEGDAFPPQ